MILQVITEIHLYKVKILFLQIVRYYWHVLYRSECIWAMIHLLEQGYVQERLKSSLRKFYGRYGDLIKQYEVSLSQMLNDILWPDHIQWQPPTDQTLYRTRLFTEFWMVSIEHLRRVWHGDRDAYSSGPWSRPFGTCICFYLLRPILSELVVILPHYALRISLGTFSILLSFSEH